MTVTYLQIDSRHRLNHEQDSKINVKLNHPIHNCQSVSVANFGVANEFWNILANNDTVTIVSQVYDQDIIKVSTYYLNPGFYTISEMVASLQEQSEANGNKLINDSSINFTATYDIVSEKVSMIFSGPAKTRVVLYFPDIPDFENSPLFRMGFTRPQCLSDITQRVFDRRGDGSIVAVQQFKPGVPEYVPELNVSYSIARPPSSANNTIVARANGFETSPYLLINSSLVNDFLVNSSINGDVSTISTSILQRINVTVNRSSWITYESLNSAHEHQLHGKTLNSFWISMNDHINKPFQADHFRNYSVTLKITSYDNDENINEKTIMAIRDLMFKKQHKCFD